MENKKFNFNAPAIDHPHQNLFILKGKKGSKLRNCNLIKRASQIAFSPCS